LGADAGIVHQDVGGPEFLLRRPAGGLDLGAVGDVAGEREPAEVPGGLGGQVAIDVEHRDPGAAGGEHARDGGADATARAGHDRDAPGMRLGLAHRHYAATWSMILPICRLLSISRCASATSASGKVL